MSGSKKTGQNGINLVKEFEGLELKPYKDVVGKLTIGYGHLILPGENFNKGITESEAENILRKDLKVAEDAINKLVKVPLAQNQFDALVSFTFNLGVGNLQSSTLLKMLNASNYAGASQQFLRWNKAGGKEVAGLTRRRQAESKLFLS